MDWAKSLQDEMNNIKVSGFGAAYIRDLTGHFPDQTIAFKMSYEILQDIMVLQL